MNFTYYVGPIEIRVGWRRNLEPLMVDVPYLRFFKSGEVAPRIHLEIECLESRSELGQPRGELKELPESWRIWPEDFGWCIQFWSGATRRYCLEAKLNSDFTKAQVFCLRDQPEERHLSFLIATLLKWMCVHVAAQNDGFLLHSAGIMTPQGKTLLASAPSGGGKTTISSFFLEHPQFTLLTDETVLIFKESAGYFAYGTPWHGMLERAKNCGGEISALFLLEKASSNQLSSISQSEATLRLLKEVFLPPWNEQFSQKVVELVSDVVAQVPVRKLAFQKSPEIVTYLMTKMRNWEDGQKRRNQKTRNQKTISL